MSKDRKTVHISNQAYHSMLAHHLRIAKEHGKVNIESWVSLAVQEKIDRDKAK